MKLEETKMVEIDNEELSKIIEDDEDQYIQYLEEAHGEEYDENDETEIEIEVKEEEIEIDEDEIRVLLGENRERLQKKKEKKIKVEKDKYIKYIMNITRDMIIKEYSENKIMTESTILAALLRFGIDRNPFLFNLCSLRFHISHISEKEMEKNVLKYRKIIADTLFYKEMNFMEFEEKLINERETNNEKDPFMRPLTLQETILFLYDSKRFLSILFHYNPIN